MTGVTLFLRRRGVLPVRYLKESCVRNVGESLRHFL